MFELMVVGLCLIVLGIGGRVAVGRSDSVKRMNATRAGNPAPRPSKARKRAANSGIGIGVAAVIAALIFGGRGFGFGTGTGTGTGGQAAESTVSATDSSVTYEESARKAQDTNSITIRVNKTDIYLNGFRCGDSDAFEKMLGEIYEDGMNITVVDNYADDETHNAVTDYLRENAYTYQAESED